MAVRTVEQLAARLAPLAGALGFDHFACGTLCQNPGTGEPVIHLLSRYPAPWQARYDQEHYFEQDPVITHTIRRRRPIPMSWPEPGALEDPLQKRIFAEAADFGLRSGLTVSVQGSGEIGVLSLAAGRPPARMKSHLVEILGSAQILASYLQEAWNRLSGQAEAYRNLSLSGRELECLHWAAIGKTSWEISAILGIAERTVIYHIGRAVQKLGVSNRRQAVARAVTLGLIRP